MEKEGADRGGTSARSLGSSADRSSQYATAAPHPGGGDRCLQCARIRRFRPDEAGPGIYTTLSESDPSSSRGGAVPAAPGAGSSVESHGGRPDEGARGTGTTDPPVR